MQQINNTRIKITYSSLIDNESLIMSLIVQNSVIGTSVPKNIGTRVPIIGTTLYQSAPISVPINVPIRGKLISVPIICTKIYKLCYLYRRNHILFA